MRGWCAQPRWRAPTLLSVQVMSSLAAADTLEGSAALRYIEALECALGALYTQQQAEQSAAASAAAVTAAAAAPAAAATPAGPAANHAAADREREDGEAGRRRGPGLARHCSMGAMSQASRDSAAFRPAFSSRVKPDSHRRTVADGQSPTIRLPKGVATRLKSRPATVSIKLAD